MIYQTDNNGAQPSGKAAVFDTVILGSNPSAPANKMDKLLNNINFYQKIKKIFFPFYKSKDIKNLFSILEKGKLKDTQVAMFVGGCVRKFLTNQIIDDIDIATIFSPEEIKEKFRESNFKIIDTGIKHGSMTAIINSNKFEITTLRQDVKTDGRHAEISFTDNWKRDSERRDFTINAIYMDRRGKIYSFFVILLNLQFFLFFGIFLQLCFVDRWFHF